MSRGSSGRETCVKAKIGTTKRRRSRNVQLKGKAGCHPENIGTNAMANTISIAM
jgi:hypothetical protein